jgi:succinate dehydrogenase / fumarate reductase cytochrome b subunit
MPKEKNDNRPLSPHLQVYAWNISSLTSIMHRATGVLLYIVIVAISWFVVFFTYNVNNEVGIDQPACDCMMLRYVFGAVLFGIIFALYFHFCNGIRHLIWDIGKGYELQTARKTGFLVIICAVLFTFATIAAVAYFKFM